MPVKHFTVAATGLIVLLSTVQLTFAAELMTLFTTPQERQLIDSNRYKSDEVKPPPVQVEEVTEAPILRRALEKVTLEYKVSGITISHDGPHTVWINSTVYQDGGQLEDKSKIKVMVGDDIRVRITAPDGKKYYATSGETLEVTYLTPARN